MGIQHTEFAPRSFLEGLQPGYLGDPAVVDRLIAGFLVDSEADLYDLGARHMGAEMFAAKARGRIDAIAARFTGEHPEHPGVKGFHGVSLPAQLQAALGDFWRQRRDAWRDNPVAVLFEWLLLKLTAAWKMAEGDDTLLQASLGPDVATVRNLLLGVSKRV